MTGRFGIDTSVLVRLTSRQPESEFLRCVGELRDLLVGGAEIVASNQVIGEAYVAIQHHYGVTKVAARATLLDVFESGVVEPLNGEPVLELLREPGGPGLVDRLIVDGYSRNDIETLTLDRRMANLPGSRLL
ncbi:MAG: PIN domain-containing protein [Chloroflexi bacterium]|nr:PIN domain-containing protein [Chloroflexota bacterium]